MKVCNVIFPLIFLVGCSTRSSSDITTPAAPDDKNLTKEERQDMAKIHHRMAECLESSRPFSECQDEMMKACSMHNEKVSPGHFHHRRMMRCGVHYRPIDK